MLLDVESGELEFLSTNRIYTLVLPNSDANSNYPLGINMKMGFNQDIKIYPIILLQKEKWCDSPKNKIKK